MNGPCSAPLTSARKMLPVDTRPLVFFAPRKSARSLLLACVGTGRPRWYVEAASRTAFAVSGRVESLTTCAEAPVAKRSNNHGVERSSALIGVSGGRVRHLDTVGMWGREGGP